MENFNFFFRILSQDLCKYICFVQHPSLQFYERSLNDFRNTEIINCSRFVFPDQTKQITGDGNCLFRAVSFIVTGSELNYMSFRVIAAKELKEHYIYYENMEADFLVNLLEITNTDRAWDIREGPNAAQYKLQALSIALRVRIFVFNRFLNVPEWFRRSTLFI